MAYVRRSSVLHVVVVLGAHELDDVDAPVVYCEEWERGPGASLRCGLRALAPEVDAAVVVLADGPDLDPRSIDQVIRRWQESAAPVVACAYGRTRLHPVLLAREVWRDVPDAGARKLPALLVDCSRLDPPGDVDFADDLPRRLRTPNAEP